MKAVIESIDIAASPQRALAAIVDGKRGSVVYRFHRAGHEIAARYRVVDQGGTNVALASTSDATLGERVHFAIVPAGSGARIALVAGGARDPDASDAWRSFLVNLKDSLES
jgi:hypothetical protein